MCNECKAKQAIDNYNNRGYYIEYYAGASTRCVGLYIKAKLDNPPDLFGPAIYMLKRSFDKEWSAPIETSKLVEAFTWMNLNASVFADLSFEMKQWIRGCGELPIPKF